MNDRAPGVSGYVLLLIIQLVFIGLFGVFTDYDTELKPKNGTQAEEDFIIPKYARKFTKPLHTSMKISIFSLSLSR